MSYNITQLQASTTIIKLVVYANDAVDGLLLGLFIIAIFFVLLMVMKKYEFDFVLFTSSWISFVLSSILVYAKLLNFIFPLSFLALAAFTGFYLFVVKR